MFMDNSDSWVIANFFCERFHFGTALTIIRAKRRRSNLLGSGETHAFRQQKTERLKVEMLRIMQRLKLSLDGGLFLPLGVSTAPPPVKKPA
jgi:hypothetical protein